jgi:hypothetical protein
MAAAPSATTSAASIMEKSQDDMTERASLIVNKSRKSWWVKVGDKTKALGVACLFDESGNSVGELKDKADAAVELAPGKTYKLYVLPSPMLGDALVGLTLGFAHSKPESRTDLTALINIKRIKIRELVELFKTMAGYASFVFSPAGSIVSLLDNSLAQKAIDTAAKEADKPLIHPVNLSGGKEGNPPKNVTLNKEAFQGEGNFIELND